MFTLVSYDLDKPGQNYQLLIAALQSLGFTRILLSTWVKRGQSDIAKLRDLLWSKMDGNDRLIVANFDGSAWQNLLALANLNKL